MNRYDLCTLQALKLNNKESLVSRRPFSSKALVMVYKKILIEILMKMTDECDMSINGINAK